MTTNTHMSPILYLNRDSLDLIGLEMSAIVDILEEMFQLKATGHTLMPPKIFFHIEGNRFYSAMASCSPKLGYAACKWQSGDPENRTRGLPYIQGLLVLSEHETGQMVAIMDAKWITGMRTAAASALVARHQARKGSNTLCLLGCGLQGRAHLEALAGEVPTIRRCQVYDIIAERQAAYIDDMSQRFSEIEVVGSDSAESAVRGADIVIPGGPITEERNATIPSDWIKPGALIVTIDYDSYVTDECIDAMDIVMTDDYAQIEDARKNEHKFLGVTRIDADIAELISKGKGRRSSDSERIIAFNLGIALEDLATAAVVLELAKSKNAGLELAP